MPCSSILSKASGGLKDSKVRNNDRWERVKEREGSDKEIIIVSSCSRKKPPVLRDYGRSKSQLAQVGWISRKPYCYQGDTLSSRSYYV